MRNSITIAILCYLFLFLPGCGGGGGSSQVVQTPPSAPSGVQVEISAQNELAISWNASADATSYNIYWSSAAGVGKNSSKLTCSGTSTSCVCATPASCVHTGLTGGSTYYYVVTAVNSFGESAVSAEVFAQLAAPSPPGSLAAVSGDGQVTVSWSTNGANSYNVYMSSQPGVTNANYATLTDGAVYSSTAGSYSLTGLSNGKTYYFVVTSVNGFFGESSESSEISSTPAAVSSLTVSGTVRYEDKEYGLGGFTGKTSYKAVRFAEIEAVDSASGTTIAGGTTDASGQYVLTIPSAATIYVRVVSSALTPLATPTPMVGVRDFSNALYAVAGSNITVSGAATENISIPATNWASGAFNALDVFTSGAQFVESLSGTYPTNLAAFWETGNDRGTYYCNGGPDIYCPYGEGIYILSSNGDTDEYDDDVLWHEFGHFIASKYSKDDSPGGVHYIFSNDLDLRLSWSEGWGDFFPPAVKSWLGAASPSLLSTVPLMSSSVYVDTWGGSASYFDFGNPGGTPYVYSGSEAAVAKVLVVLKTNIGMQAVWDTFTSANIKNATTPVNFEVFWDAWTSLGQVDIATTLSERLITYAADAYEATGDNSPISSRKAVIGVAEDHTLFGGGDIDNIAFDAVAGQTYTVKTSALKNGADTYVRIIAPDQLTTVVSNDNSNGATYSSYPFVPNNCDAYGECHENGFDILGSTSSFTAAATGTYFVEVMSSPNKPLSAGKYGGYSLKITSP